MEIPYVKTEYAGFKKQLQEVCEKYHAAFMNLENEVPPQYWGYKAAPAFGRALEIDFMHFQYPGHVLVAKALQPQIEKLVE